MRGFCLDVATKLQWRGLWHLLYSQTRCSISLLLFSRKYLPRLRCLITTWLDDSCPVRRARSPLGHVQYGPWLPLKAIQAQLVVCKTNGCKGVEWTIFVASVMASIDLGHWACLLLQAKLNKLDKRWLSSFKFLAPRELRLR